MYTEASASDLAHFTLRSPQAIRELAFPILLFLVGFCIRRESGLIALAFLVLLVGICLVTAWAKRGRDRLALGAAARDVRPIWVPTLVLVCSVGTLLTINNSVYSSPEWSEYWRQSSTMAAFTDYPRSDYKDHQVLYRSLGWSENLYTLVRGWYQLDPRFDADSARIAIDADDYGVQQLMANPLGTLWARIAKLRQPVAVSFILILTAATVWSFVTGRGWRRLATALGTLLVMGLSGYLLVRGRLLDRALYAIICPAVSMMTAMALSQNLAQSTYTGDSQGEGRPSISRPKRAMAVCLVLSLVMGAAALKYYGRGSGTYDWFKWQDRNVEQFYDICEENPGTLYIFAGLGELDNMNPWRMEWPVNQTSWATWYYRAPWFAETLKEAGFKGRPTVYDLLDSNVRLVTDSYTDLDLYTRYLKETLGEDVTLEQERVFGDDVTIWRVVRA